MIEAGLVDKWTNDEISKAGGQRGYHAGDTNDGDVTALSLTQLQVSLV